MKAVTGQPDRLPPLYRTVIFWIFCWANRSPRFLRFIGFFARFWPFLFSPFNLAARRSAVHEVLSRPRSFSNTSHAMNLIADDFLIGMDANEKYMADRAIFDSVLQTFLLPNDVQQRADAETKTRINSLNAATVSFDLVEDYLMWIVLSGIAPCFGGAIDPLVANSREALVDEETKRAYLHEVKHVAAYLFSGRIAPLGVQRRAELAAASLRERIVKVTPEIAIGWPSATRGASYSQLQRNAIGLAWVSHPVTVQSGALVFQELLGRRAVYTDMRKQAAELKQDVWTDSDFRTSVTNLVLELMRFRPVFPLMARDTPRDTEFESGARSNAVCLAGSGASILNIAGMFDATEVPGASNFCPARDWGAQDKSRYMMFGYGSRQCPAKNQAVVMITSGLIGLLTLPEITWANAWPRQVKYDGPVISRMRLQKR